MPTPCFWVQESGESVICLRRYSRDGECPLPYGYHNAQADIDVVPSAVDEDGVDRTAVGYEEPPFYDNRWPQKCNCGYEFTRADRHQVISERLYVRPDTGETYRERALPAGAMYDARWEHWRGPDGVALTVVLPGGHHWHVDDQASNCTRRGEPHQCWVRHGEPPNVTVDKGGDTCAAGGGSILYGQPGQPGYYHGFLQNGVLTDSL